MIDRQMRAALACLLVTVTWMAAQEPPAPPEPVRVPVGDGSPVITDGMFSPGEWDDSHLVALTDHVELRLKQYRGVVFLGIRGLGAAMVGTSELFLAAPGGPIHQLHVSAQLGEILLPPSGAAPRFRWGLTSGWYANEQRRDMVAAERMQEEGKLHLEIIQATSYPSDGIEFAIRRSKVPGERWRVRLGVSVLAEGKPGWLAWPAGVPERTTEGWLELRLD